MKRLFCYSCFTNECIRLHLVLTAKKIENEVFRELPGIQIFHPVYKFHHYIGINGAFFPPAVH